VHASSLAHGNRFDHEIIFANKRAVAIGVLVHLRVLSATRRGVQSYCHHGGACITGGMELALNCDIIIASNTAFFQDTHTRYGIVPAAGMTSLLPKAIGLHAAKWMSLTGARVPAQRAHDLGLVAKVGVLHDFGVLSSFPVQMGWTRHHNQMSACHV